MRTYRKKSQLHNRLILTAAALLLILSLCACGRQEKIPYTKTDFYFDTVVTLTIYDLPSEKEHVNTVLEQAMAECARYEDMLSAYKEGSEIDQINHAQGEWVFVSDETKNMLFQALTYCNMTDGMIDITIKPVKDLWNFTPDAEGDVPSSDSLEQALTHVDYRQLEIDGNKVRLEDPNAAIDPGFIAKGYIADQLKSFLLSKDVTSAIINLGGNVQTIGAKPDGTLFSVGVQKPWAGSGIFVTSADVGQLAEDGASAASLSEAQTAVATSGVYERYFKVGDLLYHHILDTKTGRTAETDLDSATILAHSATDADALSTTCLLLGSEKAESYIRSLDNIDAILIKQDGTIIDTRNQ